MAFTPEPTITATDIGNIVVILKDGYDELGDPFQSAHFQVVIERSDGSENQVRGNLVPHITPAQRTALLNFMSALRTQAETEILP